MMNIQPNSKLNSMIQFNRRVNPKKKKIIQLSALSISHSNKQKKLNNLDSKFKEVKEEEGENEQKMKKVNKKFNDLDIINEFKQLSGSTWSFDRSNNLLSVTPTIDNQGILSSPTISSGASSDGSFDFDSLAFPMPPPPRSTLLPNSLPSTPIHQIPFTHKTLRRLPSTSQLNLSSRASIPISEAFDPSQPPKLPLPPLPSNPSLGFHFKTRPKRSSSLKVKSSSMLYVHQHQTTLPTPSVKLDGILGGLAIDTSHTNRHWPIHQKVDHHPGKSADCSAIISPIKIYHPHLDNLTSTNESPHQYRQLDQQHVEGDTVGLMSNPSSHPEELKKSLDLDTVDDSLLSEELFLDSIGEDDFRVSPRPIYPLEDDDDLLKSSYESIDWSDVVMLPEEEDLIEIDENFTTSTSTKESNMDLLDQSFSEATSSFNSSCKATSSEATQLTSNSSVELDTISKAKRSSLTSNNRYSTFSVGDLSEWIKQHHGNLDLPPGQLQSDDDESEIDLEESLDRLAKRLGYQDESIEDQPSHSISFQDPLSPSSPLNLPGTELHDDYDRDDLLTTMENPIIPGGENKVKLSLVFSPTFNAEPSTTRSDGRTRSSSSTCSFTTNSTASILTPITPIDHKPFHQLPHSSPQSKLRHQFSLSKLNLGSTNRPILEYKRSSLSLAAQSNTHSKFKPTYRPQPMKVIEEPSSSDEEEFDLTLDHPPRPSHLPNSLPFTSKFSSIKAPRSIALPSPTTSLFATLPRPSSTLRRQLEPSSLQSNTTQSSNLVQPQSHHGSSRKRSGTIHETSTAHNGEESNTPLAFGFAKTAIPRGALPKTMLKAPRVQLFTPNLRSSIPKPSFTKAVNSQPTSWNAKSVNVSIASPHPSSSLIKPKLSHDQLPSVINEVERRLPSLSRSVGSSIPGRTLVHSSHSASRQQLRVLSQPSHPQINENQASNLSPSLTPTMSHHESNPSPLDVMSPPGQPGSFERRQWLSGVLSRTFDESDEVEGERPASASIVESFGRVSIPETSRRVSSSVIDSSYAASHSRAPSLNQQLSSSITTEENQRSNSKWSRNMNLQSESIFEAPEEEGQTEDLTSSSMSSESSSAERKLRLKPLFLGSSALPGDRILSCEPMLRQVKSRASLPPSANRLTFSNHQPLMSPYLNRRSSIGFSPSRSTSFSATMNSNLFGNEKESLISSSSSNVERSPHHLGSHSRASGSISIRQLTYN